MQYWEVEPTWRCYGHRERASWVELRLAIAGIMSVSLSSAYQPDSYLDQGLPACRTVRKHFCCLCYPASGVLLWQSEQTKIDSTCPASAPTPKLTSLSITAAFLNWAQRLPYPERMFYFPWTKMSVPIQFSQWHLSWSHPWLSPLFYWCW